MMSKKIISLSIFITFFILNVPTLFAQNGTIDAAGDIAFVAYHDDDDGFSFLLIDDAPNGTSIRFLDDE